MGEGAGVLLLETEEVCSFSFFLPLPLHRRRCRHHHHHHHTTTIISSSSSSSSAAAAAAPSLPFHPSLSSLCPLHVSTSDISCSMLLLEELRFTANLPGESGSSSTTPSTSFSSSSSSSRLVLSFRLALFSPPLSLGPHAHLQLRSILRRLSHHCSSPRGSRSRRRHLDGAAIG